MPDINTALALLPAPEEVKEKVREKHEAGEKALPEDIRKWKLKARR